MRALQYIYTSWKNGDSADKGFMIYSKSTGITDEECEEIKFVMQYTVPKEMTPNPSPEEILDTFPYSFAYFVLSSGRACIAQATYLGKDYSGRYGNYLIHALVVEMNELDVYPVELFGEDYIKTSMTEDELNAVPPVPPLPSVEIDDYGRVINDEQIMEFLYDKEDEFAYLVSALLDAKNSNVPFYLNDTRENLVLWLAAIHKMLPLSIAKSVTFSTYVGNHEKFRLESAKEKGLTLNCYCVRPDANYFNYSVGAQSSQQIVMDFIGGNMTDNIKVLEYAKSMASAYTLDIDEIHEFCQFMERIGYSSFDRDLDIVFIAYDLHHSDNIGEGAEQRDRVLQILSFGEKYGNQEINSELGAKLLEKLHDANILSVQDLKKVIPFLYRYASFMMFSIHEILYNALFDNATDPNGECSELFELLKTVHEQNPNEYRDFLRYFATEETAEQTAKYLKGNPNKDANLFYVGFILSNYQFPRGLQQDTEMIRLVLTLFVNIRSMPDRGRIVIEILECVRNNVDLMGDILVAFIDTFSEAEIRAFGSDFGKWMDRLPDSLTVELQQMMASDNDIRRFAVYLNSMYIYESANPEQAFWKLYHKQFSRKTDTADIGPMVEMLLKRTRSAETAIKIIETIPEKNIASGGAIKELLDILSSVSIKELSKVKPGALSTAIELAQKRSGSVNLSNVTAVCFAKWLQVNNRTGVMEKTFASAAKALRVQIGAFDKKDYHEYIYEYLPLLLDNVDNANDFRALLKMCYHAKHLDYFSDEVTGLLKKYEKNQQKKWTRKVTLICVCLIDCKDKETDDFAKRFLKYLRKFGADELKTIKTEVLRLCQDPNTDFFDRMYDKEGLGDKLGGFFGKK